MNSLKIKSDFHKLIDKINDETVLLNFFDALKDFVSHSMDVDIVDELTKKQKSRLKISLEQSRAGKTITDNEMKKEIRKWLGK